MKTKHALITPCTKSVAKKLIEISIKVAEFEELLQLTAEEKTRARANFLRIRKTSNNSPYRDYVSALFLGCCLADSRAVEEIQPPKTH